MKKNVFLSEFIGTFILVLMGTGTAVFSNGNAALTALAFGISLIAVIYIFGSTSGGHFNPIVSFAMLLNKKIDFKTFTRYSLIQLIGAVAASATIFFIAGSSTSLGQNMVNAELLGTGSLSIFKGLVFEILISMIFVLTILGMTRTEGTQLIAGLIIGIVLTGVIILGFNITGVSVNPVRSLAPALFSLGDSMRQVWIFVVGPFLGSFLAVIVENSLNPNK
jgi:aquaporin Z